MFTVLLSFAASLHFLRFLILLCCSTIGQNLSAHFLQQAPRRNTRKRAWNYSNRTRMISPNFGISASKMWGEERQVGWQEEMIFRLLEKMIGAREKHFAVSSLNEL